MHEANCLWVGNHSGHNLHTWGWGDRMMKGQPNRDSNSVPPSQGINQATNWANEASAAPEVSLSRTIKRATPVNTVVNHQMSSAKTIFSLIATKSPLICGHLVLINGRKSSMSHSTPQYPPPLPALKLKQGEEHLFSLFQLQQAAEQKSAFFGCSLSAFKNKIKALPSTFFWCLSL